MSSLIFFYAGIRRRVLTLSQTTLKKHPNHNKDNHGIQLISLACTGHFRHCQAINHHKKCSTYAYVSWDSFLGWTKADFWLEGAALDTTRGSRHACRTLSGGIEVNNDGQSSRNFTLSSILWGRGAWMGLNHHICSSRVLISKNNMNTWQRYQHKLDQKLSPVTIYGVEDE